MTLREQSIPILPVTGRDFNDVGNILKTNDITGLGVFSGGATIINIASGEHCFESHIEINLSRQVISEAKKFAEFIGYGLGRIAISALDVKNIINAPLSVWIEFPAKQQSAADELTDKFPELSFHSSVYQDSSSIGLHVTPYGINKKTSALRMLMMLHIDPDKTVTIGDEMNDAPLFEVSPVSIAMGNAPDTLKKLATHIAPNIEDNGFEQAIFNFILKN